MMSPPTGMKSKKLTAWCSVNNLPLNLSKTKELIIDFRRKSEEPAPLHVRGVSNCKFLNTQRKRCRVIKTGSHTQQTQTQNPIPVLRHKHIQDSSHPSNHLFTLPPSGRRYSSVRLLNSFYPCGIKELNSHYLIP